MAKFNFHQSYYLRLRIHVIKPIQKNDKNQVLDEKWEKEGIINLAFMKKMKWCKRKKPSSFSAGFR